MPRQLVRVYSEHIYTVASFVGRCNSGEKIFFNPTQMDGT